MKSLAEYIHESIELEEQVETTVVIEEAKIESEEDFREAAKKKFEQVFGDELDEKKMKETIDGLLKDNQELVDDDKWGELMGMLNKSFNESEENEEPIEESMCCKDLDKCSENELWDKLGELHKIKNEKERSEMFDKIKSQILKIQNEK